MSGSIEASELTRMNVRAPIYPPAEQIGLLRELLDTKSARPHAEDLASVAAFAMAANEAIRVTGATAEAAAMLRRACEVFPHSARLADRLGHVLYSLGEIAESSAHFRRALELRQIAKAYSAEFPRDDGSFYYWQFAEHIQRNGGVEGDIRGSIRG